MFEDFSSGYYLGRLYVEPHDSPEPVIHDEEYRRIHGDVYGGDGEIAEEMPLVFKLDSQHLPVKGGEGVPSGTLGVPEGLVEEIDLDNPPSVKNVLLAKKRYAERVLELLGRRSRSG